MYEDEAFVQWVEETRGGLGGALDGTLVVVAVFVRVRVRVCVCVCSYGGIKSGMLASFPACTIACSIKAMCEKKAGSGGWHLQTHTHELITQCALTS